MNLAARAGRAPSGAVGGCERRRVEGGNVTYGPALMAAGARGTWATLSQAVGDGMGAEASALRVEARDIASFGVFSEAQTMRRIAMRRPARPRQGARFELWSQVTVQSSSR